MRVRRCKRGRRGVVLVLVALLLIPMVAFLALAIDLGMAFAAKSQIQNVADAAALAGLRNINGDPDVGYNHSQILPVAMEAADANTVFGNSLDSSLVKVESGYWTYNDTAQAFEKRSTGDGPMTLVEADVYYTQPYAFAGVLGMASTNMTAHAAAVHRPRDVVVVMDFSGSMRFDSLIGIDYSGTRIPGSNNPESVFPQFGHYSDTTAAALQNSNTSTLAGYTYGSANVVTTTNAGDPILDYFYSTGTTKAFPSSTMGLDSYATAPAGDVPLRENKNTGGGNFARMLSQVSHNDTTTRQYDPAYEANGYNAYTGTAYQGYTMGPRFWGKTFWIWPPDPTAANDWRQKYFKTGSNGSTTGVTDNRAFYDSSGNWLVPASGRYRVDYNAILNFIKNVGPNPFPSQLRAGGILYYSSIPDSFTTIDVSPVLPTFTNTPTTQTERDERFWKDYIDHVLGIRQGNLFPATSSGSSYNEIHAETGYGADYTWTERQVFTKPAAPADTTGYSDNGSGSSYPSGHTGSIRLGNFGTDGANMPQVGQSVVFSSDPTEYYAVTARQTGSSSTRPNITLNRALVNAIPDGSSGSQNVTVVSPFMDYRDNPERPKVHFWFGAMSMIDFLGNYNENRFWWPGRCTEAPLYQSKIGVQNALEDIKKNHPNDYIGLAFFSSPKTSATSSGRQNRPRAPLGKDYDRMINALYYPLYYLDNNKAEISPYDTDADKLIDEVPNAQGGTCYPMGLMLAYNQFSSASILRNYNTTAGAPEGDAGGLGRKGAARLVIFETDGMVNVTASASFTNNGAANSYYNIRQPNEFPSGTGGGVDTAKTQTYDIVDKICALETDTSVGPGYGLARKPVLFHCLAFGTLFEPTSTDPNKADALEVLQTIQFKGGKAGGEQPDTTTPLADYKMIVGDSDTRIAKLKEALINIMQDGVQVSLIE